jgi:hypothetical protein
MSDIEYRVPGNGNQHFQYDLMILPTQSGFCHSSLKIQGFFPIYFSSDNYFLVLF